MALVCLCNGVSERKVVRAIDHGASTIEEIGRHCRAGITCHGCHDTLQALLDEHCRPVVASRRAALAC
ncbi:MAG TPA: (2Fe-2S)-binding protein [Ilumatobacter sp.]|nr:(2Fe-2S)-binding protein [Ilumatobacter sp.]